MKKFYPMFLCVAVALMLPFMVNGQAKKLIMFEHFTQASCGPCAQQNPVFHPVYLANKHNVNHVAYHTSWPGVDPMNAANPTEVQTMVDLYKVSGVPNMISNGVNIGSPTAATQELINQAGSSPVRISVEDIDLGGGNHQVKVKVYTLADVPPATYIMRTLLAEENVTYTSAPGSNGEKEFPNVFRKFINTNGSAGDAYVPAQVGEFTELNYNYTVDPSWKENEIYPIAYIQNVSTKEVIQSGSSRDEKVEAVNVETKVFQVGNLVDGNEFKFNLTNLTENDAQLQVSIQGTWPADWGAYVDINGAHYNSGDTLIIPANATINATLKATVGPTPGIGDFSAGVFNTETNTLQAFAFTVISNITDLLIVTDNKPAEGNPDLKKNYNDGLVATGEPAYASIGATKAVKGFEAGAMGTVRHIYYSVGWTFPAMTPDMVGYFQDFLDNGGNIMVAGQDVNWDMASGDASANGNAASKALMNNYFNSNFIDDGSSANLQFKPVAGDVIFDGVGSSGLNKSYGATYFYPDQIEAVGPEGYNIFTYNTAAKVAAVRSKHVNFKTVNIGIGLEMIAVKAVADEIMKRTYDWFHGKISDTEFDNYLNAAMGQNYPNPADKFTVINFGTETTGDFILNIVDLTGKMVMSKNIAKGTSSESINTEALPQGIYQYYLTDGSKVTTAKKLVVIH